MTANVVAPSFMLTPFNRQKGDAGFVVDYAERFRALSPLNRLVEPLDVATAAACLASPRARCIPGEVLTVAAGTQRAPTVR